MVTKFELTTDTLTTECGQTLYRIRALRDIQRRNVKIGDLGGFVANLTNMSQDGDCWVSCNAQVFGDAWVSGNAWVFDDEHVSSNAWVS